MMENHKGQIFCSRCRKWIEETKMVRCPICKTRLFKDCVICGKEFLIDESIQRMVCFNAECLKTFRWHSGNSTQFWRSKKQKVFPTIRQKWRDENEKTKK